MDQTFPSEVKEGGFWHVNRVLPESACFLYALILRFPGTLRALILKARLKSLLDGSLFEFESALHQPFRNNPLAA